MGKELLTIVVSTFNRVERLKQCLENLVLQVSSLESPSSVSILVVNNASTDGTAQFLQDLANPSIKVLNNSINQGMLGNLSVCALNATGKYVWCIGDDDLVLPNSLNQIIEIIEQHEVPIIYANYCHLISPVDATKDTNINMLPTQISDSGIYPLYRAIQANSNLMTAIYSLILRRDQAVICYSVDSQDSPFHSLESCVPTTCYALSMDPMTKTYWISNPVIAVDLRVSWLHYAPIWILERFPEMMLSFIAWTSEKVDFRYLYQEMRQGIEHWTGQTDPSYHYPETYSFLFGITKLYGSKSDLETLKITCEKQAITNKRN